MKITFFILSFFLLFVGLVSAVYQIQVGMGPAYDVFLGETSKYYQDYIGVNIGGGFLINRVVEPHVRFGGGYLFAGDNLIRDYRLLYEPNFRRLEMYRYPLSLGINVYPWANGNPRPFMGAEIGAETVTNIAHNSYADHQQETGWGPDYGLIGGLTFPLNDVEEFYFDLGLRLRYSNTARYALAGETSQSSSNAGSTTFTAVEHLLPNYWSISLWFEFVWGSSTD